MVLVPGTHCSATLDDLTHLCKGRGGEKGEEGRGGGGRREGESVEEVGRGDERGGVRKEVQSGS